MKLDLTLSFLAFLACPTSVVSSILYCSSANTGSDNSGKTDTFQSNGLCIQQCTSEYAFAVLQGSECWCSNIVPNKATNVDSSKCSETCPGYPDDLCGSTSDGLYGYIRLSGHNPSGTATAPSSSSTSTKSSTSSESTSTKDSAPTTTGKTAVETVGGEVKTITVPNPGPTSTSTPSGSSDDDGSSLSGGAIAGIVVGSIGGVVAIAAVIFMVVLARRRQRSPSPDPSMQNILLDGRNSKGSQMSFMKGASDNHSHSLSAGSSIVPGRLPTFTDNRMKTDTVLFPGGRRNSGLSLQDNEDYSRPVLRLTNPD
ncbi:hypothetical protein FE257_004759 [Aspergillus nanangensis]|uniref:WSC domain-containing protein n=1 Tax=Aspergillus nanangensis TaxID=2582783 RepID=A0AAD4CR66_ASPNN|nr:hypothetical protein FE257_004759 [Aspergillus nanangensis]